MGAEKNIETTGRRLNVGMNVVARLVTRGTRAVLRLLAAVLLCGAALSGRVTAEITFDVVIYGGSPSGLAAAVQAARLGSSVVVVEPYREIGGMMTAGLTRTDIGDAATTGGICREFFDRAQAYYTAEGVSRDYWHFEPHVAGIIWQAMLDDAGNITLFKHARLASVQMSSNRLESVTFLLNDASTLQVNGQVFIDATYEGDLAAAAGAPYLIGRESKEQYGEPHAIDLPDKRLQAYCYRLTVTDDPDLRMSITQPEDYDPTRYELLGEYVNAKGITRFVTDCLFAKGPVKRKYDGNAQWHCWVSTDWAEINADYPEGSWERREQIYEQYKQLTLGWFYYLQHDPAVPETLRTDALRWGLVEDEHTETGHVPYMIYVREARRILGRYVFTELDATTHTLKPDSIGFGAYPIDSHQVINYYREILHLERPPGNIVIPVNRAYQIPYRVLVPQGVDRLLVSLCVSSTHLGYCTLRMEPEYIKMGQAAGAAAWLAHTHGQSPADIDVPSLQEILRNAGVILGTPSSPGNTTGMRVLYRFEDASGTIGSTIADRSPNNNHGTVTLADIGLVAGRAGFGKAGQFSGGLVQATLTGSTTVDDFGIALWMKAVNLTGGSQYLTGRNDGGGGQFAVIYEYVDNQVEMFGNSTSSPDPRPGSQISITDTGWHHIVYTRTGNEYDLYLDGAKTNIGTLSGDFTDVDQLLKIGHANSNVLLDDVAWFDEGLDQTKVNAIMTGDFSTWGGPGPTGTVLSLR